MSPNIIDQGTLQSFLSYLNSKRPNNSDIIGLIIGVEIHVESQSSICSNVTSLFYYWYHHLGGIGGSYHNLNILNYLHDKISPSSSHKYHHSL